MPCFNDIAKYLSGPFSGKSWQVQPRNFRQIYWTCSKTKFYNQSHNRKWLTWKCLSKIVQKPDACHPQLIWTLSSRNRKSKTFELKNAADRSGKIDSTNTKKAMQFICFVTISMNVCSRQNARKANYALIQLEAISANVDQVWNFFYQECSQELFRRL